MRKSAKSGKWYYAKPATSEDAQAALRKILRFQKRRLERKRTKKLKRDAPHMQANARSRKCDDKVEALKKHTDQLKHKEEAKAKKKEESKKKKEEAKAKKKEESKKKKEHEKMTNKKEASKKKSVVKKKKRKRSDVIDLTRLSSDDVIEIRPPVKKKKKSLKRGSKKGSKKKEMPVAKKVPKSKDIVVLLKESAKKAEKELETFKRTARLCEPDEVEQRIERCWEKFVLPRLKLALKRGKHLEKEDGEYIVIQYVGEELEKIHKCVMNKRRGCAIRDDEDDRVDSMIDQMDIELEERTKDWVLEQIDIERERDREAFERAGGVSDDAAFEELVARIDDKELPSIKLVRERLGDGAAESYKADLETLESTPIEAFVIDPVFKDKMLISNARINSILDTIALMASGDPDAIRDAVEDEKENKKKDARDRRRANKKRKGEKKRVVKKKKKKKGSVVSSSSASAVLRHHPSFRATFGARAVSARGRFGVRAMHTRMINGY
jgi:hypothetical protein